MTPKLEFFGSHIDILASYMTFRPMQFQPLTISTYCIFNLPQFRPKLILADGS